MLLTVALSFLAFVFLCVASFYGVGSFLSTFTVAKSARAEALPGATLAVKRRGTIIPEQITGATVLQEGDELKTPSDGRAFLLLFDESTLQVSFDTEIALDTLRTSQFLPDSQSVRIGLRKGALRVARSDQPGASSEYAIYTNGAQVDIAPGTKMSLFADDAEKNETRVIVESGHAVFSAKGKKIALGPNQMAIATASGEPDGPLAAGTNLVKNGKFIDPPTSQAEELSEGGLGVAAWLPIRDEGAPPLPAGSVVITEELGLQVARISHPEASNQIARVGITQEINASVEFNQSIELTASVKLVRQSQPVRGTGGDFYPLTVRVIYADSRGATHEWKRSFYILGDPDDLADVTRLKLPDAQWESTAQIRAARQRTADLRGRQDLVQLNTGLFMVKSPTLNSDMVFINGIEIFGYGSGFQSWVTDVELLAR